MPLRIYNEASEDQLNALVDKLDTGGDGRIEIRSGTQPAVNGALTGTLLATFTLAPTSATAFGAAAASGSGAVATANDLPIEDSSADATATAGYAAALENDGSVIFTGGVATDTSEEFQLSTLSIVSGQPVSLESLSITQPQTD